MGDRLFFWNPIRRLIRIRSIEEKPIEVLCQRIVEKKFIFTRNDVGCSERTRPRHNVWTLMLKTTRQFFFYQSGLRLGHVSDQKKEVLLGFKSKEKSREVWNLIIFIPLQCTKSIPFENSRNSVFAECACVLLVIKLLLDR